jgi:serine/threonine-protein kinase HipA
VVDRVANAYVKLWGRIAGAVSWDPSRNHAVFEYDRAFLGDGLDIAPIRMPVADALGGEGIYSFPELNQETYLGLPGLLADALPDKFGNSIIDAWLARSGRSPADFTPVERLCYTGRRAMGALEFEPLLDRQIEDSIPIEVAELVGLAQQITASRDRLDVDLGTDDREGREAMLDILRVGTSAGGNRPKAVVAINAAGKVRSGQLVAPAGYDYWLLKFDGVDDLELGRPQNYGRVEYAYYRMARAAGIRMVECRLYEENGRAHFMTRRFDREHGKKIHLQTLCGIAHYDFNMAGAYGYEQVFAVMRRLRLPKSDAIQQFRRMVFNVVARNQDDHTKNISFLMTDDGEWSLSPAYDLTYSHNPSGQWTNQHQMTLNGKRDHFSMTDFSTLGQSIGISEPEQTVTEIIDVVSRWPDYAAEAGLPADRIAAIEKTHRLEFTG